VNYGKESKKVGEQLVALAGYQLASNSQIIWKEDKDDRCGYLLKFGERGKLIDGAMTDVDLWMEMKQFFEI
jgi:hypothetical protein